MFLAANVARSCAVCAVFGAVGAVAYKAVASIPHPAESCECCGACFRTFGIHKHAKMKILVEVHKATDLKDAKGNGIKKAKGYVRVSCGNFHQDTGVQKQLPLTFQERISVAVRQQDSTMEVSVMEAGIIKGKPIGTVIINVDEIIEEGFPKKKMYKLLKNEQEVGDIELSFYNVMDVGEKTPLLVEQAMIAVACQEEDDDPLPEDFPEKFEDMNERQKLLLYSKALKGTLKMVSGGLGANKDIYLKVQERKKDKWEIAWWKDKKSCKSEPMGRIPLLHILKITKSKDNRSQFFVCYKDPKMGDDHLIFTRVDKDRDVWCDGLTEFIQNYRTWRNNRKKDEDTDGNQTNTDESLTDDGKL